MRILITTPGLKFGGAERVLSILSNQWVRMGHEVYIFITVSKEIPVYELNENVHICYCDQGKHGLGIFGIIREIRTYAKDISADLALSFMQDVAALTSVALLGMRIPLVYSERNDPNKTNNRKVDSIYRKIVENKAKYFVFQTDGARRCFKKSVQKKSCVILNPLNMTHFPLHDFTLETDEIVAVGRLEMQKNYPLLLNAFSKIKDEFPQINLLIYGSGSQRKELEQHRDKLFLSKRVFFKGEAKDVHFQIKDAKAFIMSSDYEGMPNALMEAMAMGLPCVSTDCSPGGARMLINDGVNGYIVPCNNVNLLADAIRKLLNDRNCSENLGREALKLREQVDSKEIAQKWMVIFEKILGRG